MTNPTHPTAPHPTAGLFDRVFDLVVFGEGYAAWAAACAARQEHASVLLVGERGNLVWESGTGFSSRTGASAHPLWTELLSEVGTRTGHLTTNAGTGAWLDGAVAEIVATHRLTTAGVSVLYYARPVAVLRTGELITGVRVATKSGLRQVYGRRFVDATETGSLARIAAPELQPRPATAAEIELCLQHPTWETTGSAGDLDLHPTPWPTERRQIVAVDPADPAWRLTIPAALARLEARLGDETARVSLSHLSFEPVPRYAPGPAVAPPTTAPPADLPADLLPANLLPANLVVASPALTSGAVETLADRFELGVAAAADARHRPASEPVVRDAATLPALTNLPTILSADVCVVGTGTGGSLAAIAAGRSGSRVVGVDLASYLGGVGTGGGIHTYSFGVPGGLQAEVDRRTRTLMNAFHRGPLADGPFNPWAKMITLEQMVRELGIVLELGAIMFGVETAAGRLVAVQVATADGPARIEAATFVDGTGDGDLAALAGAPTALGRRDDGLIHAYSQSSGVLRDNQRRPRMGVVNFDAGFCDPTDPADLTRARLVGIGHYLLPRYTNIGRPTYLAPTLGLRQGRQIVTDHVLSLDDQIMGRRFPDAIGFTGAHYENHASDYEFESDEALFWVWALRQWSTPIGSDLPYRILLPRGVTNLWLASRCAGVSQDAHHTTRMQRDMQRIGEAAGFAASIAATTGCDARRVPYAALRARLDETGALERRPSGFEADFGRSDLGHETWDDLPAETARTAALHALDTGAFDGPRLWWLFHHPDLVRDDVHARLADAAAPATVTWLAAAVAAMWGDPAAEPRLVAAITAREFGFDPADAWRPHGYNTPRTDTVDPLTWGYLMPHWLCAVGLLRVCGTAACLPALHSLTTDPVHGVHTVTTVALTLARLAERGQLGGAHRDAAAAVLERLADATVVGTLDNPRHRSGRYSELARRGEVAPGRDAPLESSAPVGARANALEDNRWQVAYAVSKAQRALDLPTATGALPYHDDPRALVRRAFAELAR